MNDNKLQKEKQMKMTILSDNPSKVPNPNYGKKYRHPKLTEEEKSRRSYYREQRRLDKEEKRLSIIHKANVRREILILKFMLKTDVLDHHHGRADSTKNEIKKKLELAKTKKIYQLYDSYIWNHQGEGNNHLPICQFGCIFSSREFDSIYDVPIDGTYRFEIYDSGQRGLGAFDRITAVKVEEKFEAPYVNPGALIPITAN